MKSLKVLIVEDEFIVALDLKQKLELQGSHHVILASSAEQSLCLAQSEKPDVVIMDILLSGKKTGIEAAGIIQKNLGIPVIYLTGNSHFIDDQKLKATQPVAVLTKPIPDWELLNVIDNLASRD